jgi:hypothetical protein
VKYHLKLAALALFTVIFVFVAALTCRAQPAKLERTYCIVGGYKRLSPCEWVGFSNCGNVWKVVAPLAESVNADSVFAARGVGHSIGHAAGAHAEAWYYDEQDGTWVQMDRVPAPGDTLGWIDREK